MNRIITLMIFTMVLLYTTGTIMYPIINEKEYNSPIEYWILNVTMLLIGFTALLMITEYYFKRLNLFIIKEEYIELWKRHEMLTLLTISIWLFNLQTIGVI